MKARVKPAPHALERDEGLDKHGQVGRQRQVVFTQDGGDIGQHLAQAELRQFGAVVLVNKGFELGFKLRQILLMALAFRRATVLATVTGPVDQHFGHGLRVALDQAQQQVEQFFPPLRGQAADHAEVDECDHVAGQVKHVAGVRVGMKKAVFHNHLQHRMGAAPGQQLAVKAGFRREPFKLVAGNAVDEVLRVDALVGVSPVHARHDHMRQGGKVQGDALGVATFDGQIKFAPQRAGKFEHQLARAVELQGGQVGFGQAGELAQQAQVGLNDALNTGATDLDDDFGSIVQLRAVHLRNRCGRQRFDVKARKHLFGLAAQVFAQLRTQDVKRHRGHMAVQALKLGDPFGGENVGATGQQLPQLDEGGTQFLHGQAGLHRRVEAGEAGGGVPLDDVAGALQRVGQPKAAHGVAQAVANQHTRYFVDAANVARRAQGFKQHGVDDRPAVGAPATALVDLALGRKTSARAMAVVSALSDRQAPE